MRRLLTLACEGAERGASLDPADGERGLVFVTGGTQTRIGSHRLFERLATALAAQGTPCFRFDRRGVGDSSGEDPDWRASGADLAAAVTAFRGACPGLRHVIGLGLCDGASALALHGEAAGLDGVILVNPWLVEAAPGEPAPAAIKHHYQERLRSPEGWRKILFGTMSWSKLLGGLHKIATAPDSALGAEVAKALRAGALPADAILASRDGTAIAARGELAKPAFQGLLRHPPVEIETDSHTFARPGDFERLLAAVSAALARA